MVFTVLTPAQGAILRNRIGDNIAGGEVLSDTVLDAAYTAAGLDLDLATVEALQQLIGIYAMRVDVTDTNTLITEKLSQRHVALEKLLKYWESKTGTAGGKLTTGKLKLNIDTKYADIDGA
jgi:hypothetical protein